MRSVIYPTYACLIGLTAAITLNPRTTKHGFTNPQTIHQFPDPTWVENIAIRPNGQILVDLVTTPDMYLLDPHPNSTATLIHSFSSDHAVLGLTETTPDMFHLIASNFTLTPPTIANGTDSIWTVDLTSYDHKTNTGAKIHQVVLIPESDLLNGLSTLSPEKGLIVAADSFKGVIWLINVNTGAYSILFQDPALAPTSPEPSGLSVNGIRVLPPSAHNNDTAWIYFDNTAKATFNRVPISLSALKATAAVQQLASNISIDDFALDPERGYAYVAAGAINQVFRIPLEGGTPEYVFGGLNSTVIPNPTSVAVAGEGRIYVTTTGGIESPVNGTYREGGKVVSYELGW